MGRLKTLKLTLLRASFNLLYQLFYFLGGPRKHRVTFATMRSNQLTDNLKALYAQFEKDGQMDIRVFVIIMTGLLKVNSDF
nr:hypothetical protein [Lactiplantibacillus plantarum]